MASGPGRGKLDPWGAIAKEFPEHQPPPAPAKKGSRSVPPPPPSDDETDEREPSALVEGIKRFFVLILWRPFEAIITVVGFLLGATAIVLFARGSFREWDLNTETTIIAWDGLFMLLGWVILPPLWFFAEYYVFSKTDDQRRGVAHGQELTIKIWLAMLACMIVLIKDSPLRVEEHVRAAATGANIRGDEYSEEALPGEVAPPYQPPVVEEKAPVSKTPAKK